jgi:hypothetical protein
VKYVVIMFMLIGWYAAIGFAAWLLYTHDHPVWAAVVAVLGAASVNLKDGTP